MLIKRIIIFLFPALFFISFSFGQDCVNPNPTQCANTGSCATITLSQPITTTTCTDKDYSARDYVRLSPGFSYSPTAGKKFHAWVDKNIVLPTDYATPFTETDFTNRQINTNLPVGKIEGAVNVSPSGAANYTIPISLPPGTAGITPNLSIVYNNQNAGGLLGVGWEMAGLSAISRVNNTIYQDAEVEAVNLNSDDRFALDGNRLISTSGDYGSSGTIYATEIETFSRITSNGTAGVGPESFTVETKDGLIMEYGNTSDSRLIGTGNASILVWYINKISDNFGNFVSFHYLSDDKGFRVSEIKYTGNALQDPYNKVKFVYDKKEDVNSIFVGGEEIKQWVLLREIVILCEGNAIKRYNFNYTRNVFSYLVEVQERGSDNSALNSTQFLYGQSGSNVPTSNTSITADYTDFFSGDFNGDGKDDIVRFPYNNIGSLKIYHPGKLHLNTGSGNFAAGINISDLPSTFVPNLPSSISPDSYLGKHKGDLKIVDLNGDGLSDLLIGATENNSVVSYNYYYYNGSNTDPFTIQPETIERTYGWTSLMGDFDGNGAVDLLSYNPTSTIGHGKMFFFSRQPADREEWVCGLPTSSPTQKNYKNYAIDFNGDGKSEILNIFEGSNATIHEFNNGQQTCDIGLFDFEANIIPTQIYSFSFPAYNDEIFPGDFNGDGKTDLLVWNGTKWQVGYSTGKNFDVIDFPNTEIATDGIGTSNFFIIADFDGNGMSDIIQYNGYGSIYNYFISTGMGFYHSGWWDLNNLFTDLDNVFMGDFNGDGRQDFGIKPESVSYLSPFQITYFNAGGRDNLLYKVKDGFNYETIFEYSPLTSGGTFYSKGTGAIFPAINDFQGPLYAVNSITIPDGIGGMKQTDYQYEGAKIHKQGKGFLSFSKIRAIDNNAGITTEAGYSQVADISPIIYHTVTNVKQKSISTNSIITETSIINSAKTYGNNRLFPFASQTVSINNLKNQTITSNFTYNTDGNLTNSTVDYGGAETESTVYTYIKSGSWLPNRILTQDIIKERSGEQFPVSISYDYLSGKLKEQKIFKTLDKEIITEFEYDNIGNLISTTLKSPGLINRTTTINNYDEKGRFATKVTNPLGQISEAKYDPKWGVLLVKTEENGLKTLYEYDPFGRLTKMKTPDGIETNYSLDWATAVMDEPLGNPLPVLYSASIQRSGLPNSTVFYDIYGRALKTLSEGLSNDINTIQTYNNKGQPFRKFSPFFEGEFPVSYNTYTYFNTGLKTGLLKEINNSIAGETIYDYSSAGGLFSTFVTNTSNQTSSQKTDASGKVVEATDNGGTLQYTYRGHGQLKEVKLDGKQVAFAEYDVYARQKKLKDPNAGEIEYEYNAFGELVRQKDISTGIEYTMNYDKLGRIISKTGPDGTYSWQYFTSGNATNQLKLITGPNGINQQFEYDILGRITSVTETVEGTPLTTKYDYNQFSNISQVTYPSGFKLTKTYNSKGFLTEVKNPVTNTTIWNNPELNALGQYTGYNNGITPVEKNYHSLGMLSGYQAGTGGNIHSVFFNWDDQTGNLDSRVDLKNPQVETFNYDNLNRLTESDVTGSIDGAQDIAYYENGNIQQKTRIGGYSYDNSGQLNAVQTVGNNYGDISQNTQNITYTPFNKTETITEGDYELTLTYGSDNQRRVSELKNNGTTIRKIIYSGNYEKITIRTDEGLYKTYEVHYLKFGPGLIGINVRHNNIDQLYYVYTDHLGSIVKLTDVNGNILYEQNFDPWGRERNPEDWTYSENSGAKPDWLIRGFTGHEHLAEFNLIDMNGRVYDPLLGRFNSPDNFVQNSSGTQFYNRYSYAGNNPLIYIDPSGQVFGVDDAIIIGAIILGAYLGGVATNEGELNPVQWNWNKQGSWKTYTGIVVGGFVGYLGGYWILHPGTVNLALGVITPGGSAFVVGQGSNWSFRWTTTAGGGGSRPISGQSSGPSVNWTEVNQSRPAPDYQQYAGGYNVGQNYFSMFNSAPNASKSRYIADFEGLSVYENSFFNDGSGVTFPGIGMWVGEGAYSQGNDWPLVLHEYGHQLQANEYGYRTFYMIIGPASLESASTQSAYEHSRYWTEINANQLSYLYFYDKPYFVWDYYRFPIK